MKPHLNLKEIVVVALVFALVLGFIAILLGCQCFPFSRSTYYLADLADLPHLTHLPLLHPFMY